MKNTILFITSVLSSFVLFVGCTKVNRNDDFTPGAPPPVPGGFTNSSQVATANLIAFWNFENTKSETISNTAPIVDSMSSFAPGIKGQGLKLSKGYLLFPTIAKLSGANAISSCSVSLWMNVANNGSYFTELFTLARATNVENDWLSILNMGIETGHNPSDQNLALHTWIGTYPAGLRNGGDNINDYGNVGTDYQTVPGANQWTHYIMRWDAATENIDLYANGVRVSNNNFRHRTGLGPIVIPSATQVVIGNFSNQSTRFPLSNTLGFHGFLNGSVDELRVYNKALTDQEISALFQLEKQGR